MMSFRVSLGPSFSRYREPCSFDARSLITGRTGRALVFNRYILPDRQQKSRHITLLASSSSGSPDGGQSQPIPSSIASSELLQKSSGLLKNLSFFSFWAQLALTLVSTGVLLFSAGIVSWLLCRMSLLDRGKGRYHALLPC